MEFESREHALNWMISNQLGRRNLTPNQSKYLWGLRFSHEKLIKTDNLKRGDFCPKEPNAPSGDTATRIGEEYGVNRETIKRAEKFAKVVDMLPEQSKQEILAKNIQISRTDVSTILNMEKPLQKKSH